jgi:hypothetical protein
MEVALYCVSEIFRFSQYVTRKRCFLAICHIARNFRGCDKEDGNIYLNFFEVFFVSTKRFLDRCDLSY